MKGKLLKKIVAGMVTVAMAAQFAVVIPFSASAAEYAYEQTHTGMTNDAAQKEWPAVSTTGYDAGNGPTLSVTTDANDAIGDYLLFGTSGSANGHRTVKFTFPSEAKLEGKSVLEMDLKFRGPGTRTSELVVLANSANIPSNNIYSENAYIMKFDQLAANDVYLNDSTIGGTLGTSEAPKADGYSGDTWMHVKGIMDFENKTVFTTLSSLDGSNTYYSGMLRMGSDADALGTIVIAASRNNGATIGVDNIRVRAATQEDMRDTYYMVTYDVDGDITTESVKENEVCKNIPQANKPGSVLTGWKIDDTADIISSEELAQRPVTADVKFTAQYEADPNYIEPINEVKFSTFPLDNKPEMGEDANTFADNPIALSVIGEKGTDLIANPDARVEDFNVDWEFVGFRTVASKGEPTTDPIGSFPGTQLYCDSYAQVTIDSTTQTTANFQLKNIPFNFYGKVKATVTYNGKTVIVEKPMVILGDIAQNPNIIVPKAGYISDFSTYEDGMVGYIANTSSNYTSGTDVITGDWLVTGSNGTKQLQLQQDDNGTKYLRLSRTSIGDSAFAVTSVPTLKDQVIFSQDVRFNTNDAAILYKAKAMNNWDAGAKIFSAKFDGSSFTLSGQPVASGLSKGVWYKIILSADVSSGTSWAILQDSQGNELGRTDGVVAFEDPKAVTPVCYGFTVGDKATGSVDYNNVKVYKSEMDTETFNILAQETTLAIPQTESDTPATTQISVSGKTTEGYDVLSAAEWSIADETINSEIISITPDENDSHKAVLSVKYGAAGGEVPIKIIMGGQTKTLTIKLTSNQENIAFTQSPASISIPMMEGQTDNYSYQAEVRDGNGAAISGRTITYALYDKNNTNPITAPAGTSFDAQTGVLTVTSEAKPVVFYIRASSVNSDNEPLSRSVKVTLHGLAFDFGTDEEGMVTEGFTAVTPTSIYEEKHGYGIIGTVNAAGTGSDSDANADYLEGNGFTFKANVQPNKVYNVKVTFKGIIATGKFNDEMFGNAEASWDKNAKKYDYGRKNETLAEQTYVVPVVGDVLDINFIGDGQIASVVIEMQPDKKPGDKPTWFSIGDSTIANNGSWAYELSKKVANYPELTEVANFSNYGKGGLNLHTYYNLGQLDSLLVNIRPGDVVTISGMGTNGTGSYFEDNLNHYIDSCIAMGAYVVLGSYTPHGQPGWGESIYDASTQTFHGIRKDGYDQTIRSTYERRKNEPNIIGFVDIGKITDEAMTAEVAKAKAEAIANGQDGDAAAQAKADELIACWPADHNHYTATISDLLLPELTHQMAELIKQIGIGDVQINVTYENNTVTVNIQDGTPAAINAYAAEYDADGNFIGVVSAVKAAGDDTASLTIDYTKKNEANILKVFVWDKANTPYITEVPEF